MSARAVLFALAVLVAAPPAVAGDIDRTAVDFKTPADITWVRNAAGTNEQAVLFAPSCPLAISAQARQILREYRAALGLA